MKKCVDCGESKRFDISSIRCNECYLIKMKQKDGICELCKDTTKLCRSHIYPDFIYNEMKEQGKIIIFPKNNIFKYRKTPTPAHYLLCKKCEAILNDNYERKTKLFLYGDPNGKIGYNGEINYYKIIDSIGREYKMTGIEYKTFKNFILSILWRCSVSSVYPFDRFKIKGVHEERLRNIILNIEETNEDEYPIHIYNIAKYNIFNVKLKDIMVEPFIHEDRYWLIFAGLIFSISTEKTESCIRKNNTLLCLDYPKSNLEFLNSIFSL